MFPTGRKVAINRGYQGFSGRHNSQTMRGLQNTRQNKSARLQKIKLKGKDGERYVMMALDKTNPEIYEIGETNLADGKCFISNKINNKKNSKSNNDLIEFIGDSGATEHIIKDKSKLSRIKPRMRRFEVLIKIIKLI